MAGHAAAPANVLRERSVSAMVVRFPDLRRNSGQAAGSPPPPGCLHLSCGGEWVWNQHLSSRRPRGRNGRMISGCPVRNRLAGGHESEASHPMLVICENCGRANSTRLCIPDEAGAVKCPCGWTMLVPDLKPSLLYRIRCRPGTARSAASSQPASGYASSQTFFDQSAIGLPRQDSLGDGGIKCRLVTGRRDPGRTVSELADGFIEQERRPVPAITIALSLPLSART